jgi:hypothetical protein
MVKYNYKKKIPEVDKKIHDIQFYACSNNKKKLTTQIRFLIIYLSK